MATNSMFKDIVLHTGDYAAEEYEHFPTMKKMIYVVHRLLLCDYLTMFAGTLQQTSNPNDVHYNVAAPLNLRTFRNTLLEKAGAITLADFNTGKYTQYYQLMLALCKGNMPLADDLIDMFMDSICENDPRLAMPKEFLLPFVYAVNGSKVDKDRLPNNTDPDANSYEFYNPIFYTPIFDVSNIQEHGLSVVMSIEPELQLPCFSLNDFADMKLNMPLPYRYLASMDWRGKSLTQFFGVLERFSIEHDSHVMQNDGVCTVGDLCYDIVTHSCYCRDCTPSNFNAFISCCKYLCDTWNIKVDDTAYLGELLKHGNVDQDIVNYLQKATDQITVAEMEAFNSSIFSTFIHKTISATEATDPNAEADEDDDEKKKEDFDAQAGTTDGPDNPNPDAPADNQAADDLAEGNPGGGATDAQDVDMNDLGDDGTGSVDEDKEKEDTPVEKVQRKIPPAADGILLELLNPENETLSDHLYRKEFLVRVNDLLQNTSASKKYSSQTLFMLKEWATKWLYVFSVASLKSFLRNINCSIMPKS